MTMGGFSNAAIPPIVQYGEQKEKSAARARHDSMILATHTSRSV